MGATKEWREANRKKLSEDAWRRKQIHRVRIQDWMCEYLETHPCVDCGETDIVVLEFDHVTDDKVADINRMMHNTYSIKNIEAEIAKCEVVCANCHNRRTNRRGNMYRHRWVTSRSVTA
jgi:5-methylcytosine-specific restriction endonuclease McrA